VIVLLASFFSVAKAQVNTVEFGKNRVQYQKFNWRYYQTENFNTYFSQDGLELGKYVAQIAEKELPQLEEFIEYGLQRRANIVVYNNFDEMYQSNIGLGIDWQVTGGVTKLVNNKMMLYFDGNRENMRRQVRQGIASILVANILFGDDLGEFAANQTLLDLPKWLTDGYIDYAAEEWSTTLDNQLKNELLGGDYKNFYQFAYKKPLLAGHAFWYYVGNKYGHQKTTYLLYLARIYRNLNAATGKIAKKKFKDVLKDFMQEMPDMYQKDLRGRKFAPKGTVTVTEDVKPSRDFIRFNANPQPKSFMYAVVEFRRGKYSVVLHENYYDKKTLLTYGTRSGEDEINPNYPILAWDGKGTRLAVLYSHEGKIKLFIYDVVNRIKREQQEFPSFDQVTDMKYMLDNNTLLFSAVRGGQTDIFTYKIDKLKLEQITNDVYDDLDPSFVAFPGKTGIIFSSNRPSATAPNTDTAIAAHPYNIFLIDYANNQTEFKQISQLTNLTFGNARYPSAYSQAHFTFVSDENGIQNRYAGFFRSERAGLDTLVYIGDEVLRNPTLPEVDSVLKTWDKNDIDSVGYVSVTTDSAYVFPLTNYQASLLETRTAGDNSQVSEVIRQGDTKFLYKIKVNEDALRRRNVTARPTDYRRKLEERRRMALNKLMNDQPFGTDTTKKPSDFFNSEFGNEKKDSSQVGRVLPGQPVTESVLTRAKIFEYRPRKFFNDYVVAGLNNTQFVVNKYQPYQGGIGPIDPANGNQLNGLIRMGTVDLLEDIKLSGGIRIAPNLKDNDVLFEFTNLRKRLDWGFTYYRSNVQTTIDTNAFVSGTTALVNQHSSYYLARLSYALDRVRSIRFTVGPRFDREVFPSINPRSLKEPDIKKTYGQVSAEYVYDNTLNPAQNIWHGLRYKLYLDWFTKINKIRGTEGKYLFNFGFDARHYLPIYRNVIWAVRAAGDFSWGTQKVVYYLGGVDGWLKFGSNEKTDANGNTTYRYFEPHNPPDPDADYAYQALAVNLRGFKQNVANGNNNVVINSEIRFPVFSTLFNRPINNALLRNFQLVQFVDLGTAWNGAYDKFARPSVLYAGNTAPGVAVQIKAGGIGPFAGGYGFGARSTLLGYFVRFDVAWPMDGVFKGTPMKYLALGLDF
jgi:hypothetical protein